MLHKPDFAHTIPDGDERERLVCVRCGHIDYQNPKIVVGSVVTAGDRVLLCKRAIEPRRGHWTLPAGYLELGESAEEGAIREAWEEARATIELDRILAVYSIKHISQVQIMFRARLIGDRVEPGPETEEARLFAWDEIPDELAFPSVRWALDHFDATRSASDFAPFGTPIGEFVDPVR
jgi:ADP-ribose pyrophosphatase YjhB (NUDIX family)